MTCDEFNKFLIETLEKIKDHLLKQGERSVGEDGLCKYRAEVGSKCAVGCLIPDEKYSPALEMKLVEDLDLRRLVDRAGELTPLQYETLVVYLRRTQQIHDSSHPTQWREEMASLIASAKEGGR